MGAVTTAVIAIAGVVLGWITIEIACKPCLDKGREAIDRNLNPDYDPDDDLPSSAIRAHLNPNTSDPDPVPVPPPAASAVKSV
ncbi:outer envelope membrane protein 7 [Neltuma alba]|uniref:outer envelope membrane protein 7 n=1 Tax=Neltuma alba TaxID=207710 RepID=UPI0010A3B2DC|nr:outer envelope membrane protein 7 [Prosopis alba]